MREIKFRAWDKSGETPRLTTWDELKPCTCEAVFLPTIQPHIVTLMQFTGFCDEAGNEIYEGDILQDEEGFGVVVWSKGGAWEYIFVEDYPSNFGECLAEFSGESVKIVGNICENSELLTKYTRDV